MEQPKYWFAAKRYGWGWGLPCAWQGWVVFIAFFVLVSVGGVLLVPLHPFAYIMLTMALCAALIGICLAKGEPPEWRWGGKK